MARYFNELKREILEAIQKGRSTSHEVTGEVEGNLTTICECLLRLYKLRLVDRHAIEAGIPGRPRYVYKISSRGLARLEYWEQKAEELE